MEAVFLKLLNMSITASWIVLAVILFRLLFKKAPKAFTCLLWGLVAVRLICPFSIESVLSLIPSAEPVSQEMVYTEMPTIPTGAIVVDGDTGQVIAESVTETMANPMPSIPFIASIVWLVGMAAMLIYAAISYLRVRSKVKVAMPTEDNIWICDHISTPFILGIIRPRIYLPSFMGAERDYIIAHEKAHLRRKDHWWKPLGFVLLAVYWFNPILWIAYILLCRDIELACDEKVIKDMDDADKTAYTSALLNSSISHRWVAASPLAFGEVGVKRRIKSVLNYKKPPFWIMLAAVVAAIAVAIGFLTDPIESAETGGEEVSENSSMTAEVSSQIESAETGGEEVSENSSMTAEVSSQAEKEPETSSEASVFSETTSINNQLEVENIESMEITLKGNQLTLLVNSMPTNMSVEWSSNNEMYATVDQTGYITYNPLYQDDSRDVTYARDVVFTAKLSNGLSAVYERRPLKSPNDFKDVFNYTDDGLTRFILDPPDGYAEDCDNVTVRLEVGSIKLKHRVGFIRECYVMSDEGTETYDVPKNDDKWLYSYRKQEIYSDALEYLITWTSSDPSIASVDNNGIVTLHKKGRILIQASVQDQIGDTIFSDNEETDYIYINVV